MTHALPRRPAASTRLRAPVALACLAVLALALAGCGASTLPAVHSETERLDYGRRALANREYNIAIELLKGYVTNNAGGADVDLAIEMLGEAYLHIHEWAEAQGQFERVLRDYPESDSAAAGSFHLGEAYWGQARGPAFDQEFTVKALQQWESFLRSYPGHWLEPQADRWAQRARERLADKLALTGELYIKLRRSAPARIYFRRVLEEYPNTAVAQRAELGLAQAEELDGRHAEAIAALTDLQSRHVGGRVGERVAKELERIRRDEKRGKKK